MATAGARRTAKAGRPRRAPPASERRRDPERTRERILQAALEEFAAKGFAGARVHDIAAAAGVNKQLISYYFGGKEGLYRALTRRWLAMEAEFAGPDVPAEEMIGAYLDAAITQPDLVRLLLWQGLADAQHVGADLEEAGARTRKDLEDLRRRQASGELSDEFDPEFMLLVLMAAAAAPVSLPQMVRGIYGVDAGSPEFAEPYRKQLQRLFAPRRERARRAER